MQLTPKILRAAYAYLSETPPFDGWNLPDAEDVDFEVIRNRKMQGCCHVDFDPPKFKISALCHEHSNSLLATMGHEMIHLHQWQNGLKKKKHVWHNKTFWALAREVCAIHGFDPGQF
jgi:hypothetical protein